MNNINKTLIVKRIALLLGLFTIALFIISCSPKSLNPELSYSTCLGGKGKEGSDGEEGTNNWLRHFTVDKEGSVYFATSATNNI